MFKVFCYAQKFKSFHRILCLFNITKTNIITAATTTTPTKQNITSLTQCHNFHGFDWYCCWKGGNLLEKLHKYISGDGHHAVTVAINDTINSIESITVGNVAANAVTQNLPSAAIKLKSNENEGIVCRHFAYIPKTTTTISSLKPSPAPASLPAITEIRKILTTTLTATRTITHQLPKSSAFLNLVLNNRKLSFYDKNKGPSTNDIYLLQKRHYAIRPLREQEQQRNAEDILFDMFRNEETGRISMGKFLAALKMTGIRRNDLRIKELMDNLKKVHKLANYETGSSPETQNLNRETFNGVVASNIVLIAKAFRQQFIIPDFAAFIKDIEDIYWKCKPNYSGKVADYIPQLARYSPESWGVSICTIDGQRYSIGDVDIPFTIQSCSKPLTYAIALEKLGAQVVHSYVGQEPSGRNFNELILDYNNKPHNPMINAGAILTGSLIHSLIRPEMTAAEKFDYTMAWFKRLSGGENIGFNNAVFLSEREAADRNYALGFYMRENKCYPKGTNLKEIMDFYFQCCSMETTCETMSVIAATLANGGICPTTEEKILQPEVVRDVLSIMHSCGTYDYSGQFAFKVGLPAKSGVSGGMMLVIPNVMGIFTWSPPLDQLGNSGRGLQFCEELVNIFNFHRYDNLKHATNKKDPRKHRYETKGLSIVNLLFSAASGDVIALRRHCLSGMDMRLADYDGRTALHLASSEGHLDCVKFLLEQCHVPHNPKDRWGNRPTDEARNFGHNHIVEYLEAWSERTDNEEVQTEAIIKNTEADEEIIRNEVLSSFNRSNSSDPIYTDSAEKTDTVPDDKTRPGF